MTATIIIIAQRKGGAGKTTLAAHLGVAWAAMGHEVALIDTDSQASLARWHQRREARLGGGGTGLGFAAMTGWRAAGEIERRACDCDILLVDSPASADSDVRMVIRRAGLVLVPVQPSPVDVWATLPTLEMAQRERVPALLVLNRVPARASLTASMRERLAHYDAGLAATSVGNRVALAAAFAEGWGITECAQGSSAAAEIAALAAELLELLPSSGRALPRHEAKVHPLLSDRPEQALQPQQKLGDISRLEGHMKGIDEILDDDLNALDLSEPAAPPLASDENPAHENSTPTKDQLLAGTASLKRLLTKRRT
jgi:chromosome partitioning protein